MKSHMQNGEYAKCVHVQVSREGRESKAGHEVRMY